jgi:Kef-type K+ transport system membrane component KefB
LTAGMFVVGIVFPEIGIRANLAAEIKEVAERL